MFDGVKHIKFDDAVESGMVEYIGQSVIDKFYENVLAQGLNTNLVADSGLKVVYTPLNGTGNKPVRHILNKIGIKMLLLFRNRKCPTVILQPVRILIRRSGKLWNLVLSYAMR